VRFHDWRLAELTLLALAYVGMGYLSWVVGLALLGDEKERLSGRRIALLPLMASIVMTMWDLSMEAVWADIDHAWVWRDGGQGLEGAETLDGADVR